MLKIVCEEDVTAAIDRSEALEVVAEAYRAAASKQADVSQPSSMTLRGRLGSDNLMSVKGAVLDNLGVAGFRLRSAGDAFIYILDAATGKALGLVSEHWLYRLRTATTGLVTCRALMPEGASLIALVGTGRIAEQFVRSYHYALPGIPLLLASRVLERAQAAAERWQPFTPNKITAVPLKEAVANADIVITISDANERLFEASELKARTLVCAMGGRYEFDADVLAAADGFIVDEMDFVCHAGNGFAWIKSGQVTRKDLEERLDGTIGEILLGQKSVPRNGRVLAIIQGMAVCDLALGKLALDRAN
jgi:ornithine cyclodeaminase/alanine dehydrogenase-like protein (mu-crystallin family)